MPLDPIIARGVTLPDPARAIAVRDELDNRRQYNALLERRYDTADRQYADEQAKAQEEQEMRMLYPAVKAGDPRAVALVRARIAQRNPQMAEAMSDPAMLAQMMEQGLGITPQQAPKRDIRQVGSTLLEVPDKGDPVTLYREPQRAPLQAPARPQLVEVTLPDGTTQKQWLTPGQATGTPVGAPVAPKTPAGGSVTVGPDGQLVVDPGKASEGERVSAGYLGRMREASVGLSDPSLEGYIPSVPSFMAFASLLDDETGIIGGTMANWALNDTDRQYLGNALDFILAKMRKESGATIKGGEFRKEYINYFPMPDDSPKVLADKARKRQTAMKQLEISAGRAAGAASNPSAERIIDLPTPR